MATNQKLSKEGPSGVVWDYYWKAFDFRGAYYHERKQRLTCDYAAELDPFDREIFRWIGQKKRVLDIGAGNGVTRRKMHSLGYSGDYHTLDVTGSDHTYSSLAEVTGKYGAILLLEVIEHLPISERSRYLETIVRDLLEPNGVIVISTPNAEHLNAFTRECWTHCQAVPMRDLYCYFRALGMETWMYLVKIYTPNRRNPLIRIKDVLRYYIYRFLCYFLYVDPEERILFVACNRNVADLS